LRNITIAGNYIRFSLPQGGPASVTIYDLNGRVAALPLATVHCRAGFQAVPLGTGLRSGIYLVSLRSASLNAVRKLEVVK
jgi:hypothetical protein